ncbi:MAG: SigB/SigF/SigG family RNA polymerase sigma factor [Eubacteriaceae bacterium]|jgi:RNA polymerase sigma-B factor
MEYNNQIPKDKAKEMFRELRRTGDRDLRKRLIENYMYIPKLLVKKYAYRSNDVEDIFQVACLGLMYAVDRYDPERGYEFDTFASPTIIGEIKKYYRDKQFIIRVPRRIQELNREINRARTTLEHKLMRTPTIKDIADYLEVTEEQVIEALEGNNVFYPKSLSMEFDNNSDGQETTLMDLIGDEDEQIENIGNVEDLKQRLATLNPVERMIIEERYYNGKTQKEVAAIIGKSQMTVSRLEKKVMEKLRSE